MQTYDNIEDLINGNGVVLSYKIYHLMGSQLRELLATWKEAGKKEAMASLQEALAWKEL